MDSYLRPSRISNVTQTLTQNFENEGGKDEQSVYLSFIIYSNNGQRSKVKCFAEVKCFADQPVHLFKILGHFDACSVAPTAGPTVWLGFSFLGSSVLYVTLTFNNGVI